MHSGFAAVLHPRCAAPVGFGHRARRRQHIEHEPMLCTHRATLCVMRGSGRVPRFAEPISLVYRHEHAPGKIQG
jgi:hypothetical protein